MKKLNVPQLIASSDAFEAMKDHTVGFDISFFKGDGHFVELSDCVRIPTPRNISDKKYVNVVVRDGRVHPYLVYIRFIERFNGKKVYQG